MLDHISGYHILAKLLCKITHPCPQVHISFWHFLSSLLFSLSAIFASLSASAQALPMKADFPWLSGQARAEAGRPVVHSHTVSHSAAALAAGRPSCRAWRARAGVVTGAALALLSF